MDLLIGDTLRRSAEKYPDKIAVIDGDDRITYRDLNSRANKLANALLGLKLKKGDKVAVLLYNCKEYIEIMYGLAKAGLIMVPINFRLTAEEIRYILENSKSKVLIIDPEFIDIVSQIHESAPKVKYYIYLLNKACHLERKHFTLDYKNLLEAAPASEPQVKIRESDPFFIGYTSGTTGFPKGAVRSHRADVMAVLTMALEFGFSCQDVSLMVMPLFHCNSLWFTLVALSMGGAAYLYPSRAFKPEEILKIIDREKITFISLVPTMYSFILDLPRQERIKYEIGSLRALLCSSAPLLTKTKVEILEFFQGACLFEGYGATETGLVTVLKPEDQLRKIRCAGQPVFGTDLKILDDAGKEVRPGEVGELYIKNACLLKEYYKNSRATQKAFKKNYFSVGDMAQKDKEGYFYLVDRKRDMIISGGENIYPAEIEDIISKHPKVKEVAVIGVPDEKWGEAVKAIVVLKNNQQASEEEIISWSRGKMAGYKKPKSVDFVAEMPKTATGKILKKKIREKYWQDQERKI